MTKAVIIPNLMMDPKDMNPLTRDRALASQLEGKAEAQAAILDLKNQRAIYEKELEQNYSKAGLLALQDKANNPNLSAEDRTKAQQALIDYEDKRFGLFNKIAKIDNDLEVTNKSIENANLNIAKLKNYGAETPDELANRAAAGTTAVDVSPKGESFIPVQSLTEQERSKLENFNNNSNNIVASVTEEPLIIAETNENFSEIQRLLNRTNASILGSVNAIQVSKPRPNPLDPYTSYTYGISLHVMSPKDYNDMIIGGEPYQAKNVLIASAGRRIPRDLETVFKRNPKFSDDFFIDNLRIQTIIGMNAISRGANAIDIAFTINEPYGMTLIERLLSVGLDIDSEAKSYIELPFVLQIDFYGNLADGQIVKIPQTKLIPIKIIEIKFRVTEKGSEYNVRAVPFNHVAYNETLAAAPVNFEVAAGTVEMFFESDTESTLVEDLEAREEKIKNIQSQLNEIERESRQRYQNKDKIFAVARNEAYLINSYTSAINSYYNYLKKNNKLLFEDKLEVKIHPEIAKATITFPDRLNSKKTPMHDIENDKLASSLLSNVVSGTKQTWQTFPINAGTNIVEVINQVIRNSSYILDQINTETGFTPKLINTRDPQKLLEESKSSTPLKWFKISPSVKIHKYDRKRNIYSRTVTYHVTPYIIYNQKINFIPYSAPPWYVKEYNYLYMGNNPEKPNMGPNKDILRFDIEFNALYYTAYSTLTSNFRKVSNSPSNDTEKEMEIPADKLPATINTNRNHHIAHNIQDTLLDGAEKEKKLAAGDLSKSIYNTSKDLIEVKLEIIGDPEFIKQDDVLYHAALREKNQKPGEIMIDKNNSLVTDVQEIYVRLNFRTPSDINLNTGLPTNKSLNLNNETYTINSTFSGIYRIITVDSFFNQGKFTQVLTLVRMFNQEEDYIQNPNLASDERMALIKEDSSIDGKMLPQELEPDLPIPDALPRGQFSSSSFLSTEDFGGLTSAGLLSTENSIRTAGNRLLPTEDFGALANNNLITVENFNRIPSTDLLSTESFIAQTFNEVVDIEQYKNQNGGVLPGGVSK